MSEGDDADFCDDDLVALDGVPAFAENCMERIVDLVAVPIGHEFHQKISISAHFSDRNPRVKRLLLPLIAHEFCFLSRNSDLTAKSHHGWTGFFLPGRSDSPISGNTITSTERILVCEVLEGPWRAGHWEK
jgi:hypothetical protein